MQVPANAPQITAPDSLLAAASAGDAKAQFELAESYFHSRYATLGYAEAVDWYRKSAAHGYAPAQDRNQSQSFARGGISLASA